MVDFFQCYAPFPLNHAGPAYPWTVRYFSAFYAAVYRGSDTPRRARAMMQAIYPYVRSSFRRLLVQHPADAVVSVHPLANHIVNWTLHAMGKPRPFITVVTDLFSGHALWFYPKVRRIIVPTPGARERAVHYGVPAERLTVRGLPVAHKFSTAGPARPKTQARAALGLAPDVPAVLLMGGGEGMGPVYETALAIDAALAAFEVPVQLVVIAGRNAALQAQLQATAWHIPVRVEGFVTNMPDWMAAADVLVSKAGPGTIVEGLISGLPIILMSKVPGQEDGNVDYVVNERVGVWEPEPERVAARLCEWLRPGSPALAEMSARARAMATPHAARDIAGDILNLCSGP